MKLKKAMLLLGAVCVLNTMVVGCGSNPESAADTEEIQTGEALPEESNDAARTVESDSRQETDQGEAADAKTTETNDMGSTMPETTEEDEKASPENEENIAGDPMVGIVESYEGNIIAIKDPDDDMLYYFSTENAQILEGLSAENAQVVEGGSPIALGDKVEISYRGTLDDEAHPSEAVKIVVIKVE